MKIVKIQGGLGNQMFQYAFAKSLEQHGHQVYLDTSLYQNSIIKNGINYTHNGFELENLFSITYKNAKAQDIKKLATLPTNFFFRVRRKYLTKKTHYIDKVFRYTPEVFENKNDVYLEGFWQTEKYFVDIENEIRKTFSFIKPISSKTATLLHDIGNKTIASIHVRRGDYLNGKTHAVCTESYYNNAIKQVIDTSKVSAFLIFSNDITWAKEKLNFQGTDVMFVDWNTGIESWQDMYLMSKCQVNIIANSSFSWWAAWLNEHKDKKIIAPSVWDRREIDITDHYYKYDFSDIIPKDWIRIPV